MRSLQIHPLLKNEISLERPEFLKIKDCPSAEPDFSEKLSCSVGRKTEVSTRIFSFLCALASACAGGRDKSDARTSFALHHSDQIIT